MSAAAPDRPPARDRPRRSRTVLWLIFAVSAAPVVLSYLAYYFWPPARTVNYGELIEVRQLPPLRLAQADGSSFDLSSLGGKWLLVAVDSGRCAADCARKMVYMRQLRLAQGKESDRIERVWLLNDDAAPSQALLEPFPGMRVLRAAGTGLIERFAAPVSVTDHIYVVDPLGNIMMRFPRDPDPRRMVKDLARLLKASQVG